MQEELNALKANQTRDIVDCPSGVTSLGCQWVYSIKIKADGSLDRYKAQLVALGNHQKYKVHYEETFAPVAKMGTIRTILAIAASKHWCLHQLDVKNTFLHGDLTEDIYIYIYIYIYAATNSLFPLLPLLCVSYAAPCMVSNKLLVLGMRDLLLSFFNLISSKVNMMHLCFYIRLHMELCFYWCMLMI
jgi:hypothetical protein